MDFKQHIASIPGFPKEGIIFRDVTPLLEDKDAFKACIDDLSAHAKDLRVDVVVGPESRGFIFGCPVALELGCGFVPIRKPGKLPRETVSKKYDLEYGSNEIFMHKDSIKPGMKVLIVDDLLATGGTVEAAAALIEEMGGEVVGINTETFDGNKTAIKEAKTILENQGAKYRNLSIDSSSDAGKYASDIMAFPTTILADRNGNIVGDPMLGGIDNQDNYDTLMKQIQSVIDADSTKK